MLVGLEPGGDRAIVGGIVAEGRVRPDRSRGANLVILRTRKACPTREDEAALAGLRISALAAEHTVRRRCSGELHNPPPGRSRLAARPRFVGRDVEAAQRRADRASGRRDDPLRARTRLARFPAAPSVAVLWNVP